MIFGSPDTLHLWKVSWLCLWYHVKATHQGSVLQSDFSIYVGAAPPSELPDYQTKQVHKDI